MARKPTELAPIMTRIPEHLRRRLEQDAARNGRSMNSEIIHRLDGSFHSEIQNLLEVIVNATLGGREPKWITPEHGREIKFSPSIKALMKQRIGGFIDSLPECAESTLSKEESEELWQMVQAEQEKIDEQKKRRSK
ncbi:Arc family DNA-binding protein [Nitrobacter sp. Nb-311A]|uniref:Arc family DNA-binding protein n=1 Tax=Nitrobacter sp. Nb-311A TaxID=314253 RepID=UPI000324BDCC|nr:Arc family DNA-binding protein [Nitrobacter sp. Nb-311A]